jgi:hypothetical protein
MTVSMNTTVVGINDAIRSLNKIEPGLRKQFGQEVADIAQPAIVEAQNRYRRAAWGTENVHGVSRRWERGKLPYSTEQAAKGVRTRLDTDRRRLATILIVQANPAAAVLETAGRKNPQPLGYALGAVSPGRTRIIGPAVYSKRREIEGRMGEAVRRVIIRVDRDFR